MQPPAPSGNKKNGFATKPKTHSEPCRPKNLQLTATIEEWDTFKNTIIKVSQIVQC